LAEGQLDEADGPEVVDLIGLDLLHGGDEGRQVGEIAVDELDLGNLVLDDSSLRIVLSPDHSVDLIALADEQLGQIATVLSGDTGDQRARHGTSSWLCPTRRPKGEGRCNWLHLAFTNRPLPEKRLPEMVASPPVAELRRVRSAP
jgi:hypothetical protein